MPLFQLRVPAFRSEINFLQPLFDNWCARREVVLIAGAPRWLLDLASDNAQRPDRQFAAYGYSFEADVLLRLKDEVRLVELKNAWKYEPLALAEVLHHAHLIRLHEGPALPIKPTIFGRYNAWTRAAVKELQDNGLRTDHLEYLEFDHLRDETGEYLWVDSPLSPWKVLAGPPAELSSHPELTAGWAHWFFIEHTNTWVGTREDLGPQRPLFMPTRFTMIAALSRTSGEYLVWRGQPPVLGTRSGHDWDDSFSRFMP